MTPGRFVTTFAILSQQLPEQHVHRPHLRVARCSSLLRVLSAPKKPGKRECLGVILLGPNEQINLLISIKSFTSVYYTLLKVQCGII